jgi:hypothetical protein
MRGSIRLSPRFLLPSRDCRITQKRLQSSSLASTSKDAPDSNTSASSTDISNGPGSIIPTKLDSSQDRRHLPSEYRPYASSLRKIPRLDLSSLTPSPVFPKRQLPETPFHPQTLNLTPETAENKKLTVVRFANASHNLSFSDFERVIPRGKHIPTWQSSIRLLDVYSPQRDVYFLLFPTLRAAEWYIFLAQHVHRHVVDYTPVSLASKLPIPPAFIDDRTTNEDLYTLIQSYTLLPPSRALRMEVVSEPWDRQATHIAERWKQRAFEFEKPKADPLRRRRQVQLTVSTAGLQLTPPALKALIDSDSRQRFVKWDLDPEEPTSYAEGRLSNQYLAKPAEDLSTLSQSSKKLPMDLVRTKAPRQDKFVVRLASELEARRFVDVWQGRRLSILKSVPEGLSYFKAELMW